MNAWSKKEMLQSALGALAGAGIGGALGNKVTPEVFGYADDPGMRNLSTFADGSTLGILGGMLVSKPGRAMMASPKVLLGVPTALVASEAFPAGIAAVRANSRRPNLTEQVRGVLGSGVGTGALVGGAGAGLLGLASGLSRGPSGRELAQGDSRSRMVVKDALKYLLPAMLAGGVIGHSVRDPQR